MSSLRMTFSLTSLILLIALIAMPAMAQEDVSVALAGVTTGTAGMAVGDSEARFAVIGDDANDDHVDFAIVLPDLQERLLVGTTIALLAPAAFQLTGTDEITSAANAVQMKDVTISEIMWALNTNAAAFSDQRDEQWIEFYNATLTNRAKGNLDTTVIPANMAGWLLHFVDQHDKIPVPKEMTVTPLTSGTAVAKVQSVVELDLYSNDDATTAGSVLGTNETKEKYILVDMVSNLEGGGWTVVTADGTYGQSGKIKQSATDTTAAVDLISMYRNINYANVAKDHEKDKLDDNRNAQLGAIPNGGAAGSWKKSQRYFNNNLIGTPRCATLQRCCNGCYREQY